MLRAHLLDLLEAYGQTWGSGWLDFPGRDLESEQAALIRLRGFVRSTADCFERAHSAGHVTGSALVVTPSLDRVLLMLHGKLGRWLQLGGHADGDPRVEQVALKEAGEESGLGDLDFLPYEELLGIPVPRPLPFDLDVHAIPARGAVPGHFHHDVRFLVVARGDLQPQANSESRDLAWWTLPEAFALTDEASMHRQFRKLAALAARLSGGRSTRPGDRRGLRTGT